MRKILCLCLVLTLCLCLCSCKSSDYKKAMSLYEAGEYEEAIVLFESLVDYKDSADMKTECIYGNAIALMDAGNIVEAYDIFTVLNGYKDSVEKAESIYDQYLTATLKDAKVGDIITFGSYENEKIDWYVLEKTEDRVFVISQYFVDVQCYDEVAIHEYGVWWKDCSLRTWLNKTFLNTAFTETEKSRIPTVKIGTVEGYVKGYNGLESYGSLLEERVYLLSNEEVGKYPYEVIADSNPSDYHWSRSWWLRGSAGVDSEKISYAWYVEDGTCIVSNDDGKVNSPRCVRPVLWITIE